MIPVDRWVVVFIVEEMEILTGGGVDVITRAGQSATASWKARENGVSVGSSTLEGRAVTVPGRSTVTAGVTVEIGIGAVETGTGERSATAGSARRTGADQVTAVDAVVTVETGVVVVGPPKPTKPGTPKG